MREQQALRRTETRSGMARGEDDYLPARDRGPVRRLVRDVVDSRRQHGTRVPTAGARGAAPHPPPGARGGVRRLVRAVVDSRRNLGSLFLPVAALVLVGYFIPNPAVQSYTVFVWFLYFLLIIVDSVFLGRRIRRTVAERFPGQPHRMRGLVWYGASRATMIRRWRFPKPRVARGAPERGAP